MTASPRSLSLPLLLLMGCPGPQPTPDAGAPDAGPGCVQPPSACPSTVPSYATQIEPIFKTTCLICHTPAGPGTPAFSDPSPDAGPSYELINMDSDVILGQMVGCVMPPPDAGQLLDDTDREALLTWLTCGSPNN